MQRYRLHHTKDEITRFRKELYNALLGIKDGNKPFLAKKEANLIFSGYDDDEVIEDAMEYHTPKSLAELLTL